VYSNINVGANCDNLLIHIFFLFFFFAQWCKETQTTGYSS